MKILVINPGSTSTKVAIYDNERPLLVKTIAHSVEDLKQFRSIMEQYEFRKDLVLEAIKAEDFDLNFRAVIGRGCLSRPVEGGVYEVTQTMIDGAMKAEHQHACDMGCIMAYDIAKLIPGCRAYTADPGVVDELIPYARISGSPKAPRICIWHALNQRAIARRYAKSIGKDYNDINLIVCHMGGGVSIGAHDHGRCIDVNNALNGEGPFSPERAGSLPAVELIKMCYSGKYTQEELMKRIAGKAGLTAHLGTNDVREIMDRIQNGDLHAKLIVDAMCYHIAKAISAQGAVLFGKVDAILLTGGMAHSDYLVNHVRERVEYLAPVHVFPGEDEMGALAANALLALNGEVEVKTY